MVFEFGMRASVERSLIELATPFLEELRERCRETVHLGVRDAAEVVYVSKLGTRRQPVSPSTVGGRMPLRATAVGKALLAYAPEEVCREVLSGPLKKLTARTVTAPGLLRQQLATVRERGIAYEYEESAPGIVGVAAPILLGDDNVPAAISVTGPVTRLRPHAYEGLVQATARNIAAGLLLRRSRVS
jgi:DNA-binding IclR family transcriptional regulator